MWNLSLMLLLMANVIGCKMPPKHISSGGDRDTLQIPHWSDTWGSMDTKNHSNLPHENRCLTSAHILKVKPRLFLSFITHTDISSLHPTLTDAHVFTAVTHSAAPLGHVSAHHRGLLDINSWICHHELTWENTFKIQTNQNAKSQTHTLLINLL